MYPDLSNNPDITGLSGVDRAVTQIAFALATVPGSWRVIESVALPVTPPALIIGPPRASVRGYTFAGAGVTTVQINVYAVVAFNQYAIDSLRGVMANVMYALERYTPGVVLGSVPGVYPYPSGALPAYIATFQQELH